MKNRATNKESEYWWFETEAERTPDADTSDFLYDLTFGPWISLNTGFIAGCVWGDDSTWKLQVVDLSKATEGKVDRSARFGHLELARGMCLADSLRFDRFMPNWELRATVIRQERRDVSTGRLISPYDE